MKEKIIMIVFCFVIFGISISTLFNQTVSLFKKDEKVSDVVKGHELDEYSNVAEPCCPIMRSICNPMARTTLSNQGTTVLIKIASIR